MSTNVPTTATEFWRARLRAILVLLTLAGLAAAIFGWWLGLPLPFHTTNDPPVLTDETRQISSQPLPVISIRNARGQEGESRNFELSLSFEPVNPVVLEYATADGTAKASKDYVALPLTTVTFEPGEQWMTITVETLADYEEDEQDETFFVNLHSVVGATLENAQAVGKITNGYVPADIQVARFYGDGTDLVIDYVNKGDVLFAHKVAVFLSHDGESCTEKIADGEANSERGQHLLKLSPAFDDRQRDYYLIVMVDNDGDVDETDEENNFFRFQGGAFVVHEPTNGKRILHIHGTDKDDSTDDFKPADVDDVHFRGHGGKDCFNLKEFLPGTVGWLFGGEGDDELTGSTANDIIFGGAGSDIIHGNEGDDLLVGGHGSDNLFGEIGQDELYGGVGKDEVLVYRNIGLAPFDVWV